MSYTFWPALKANPLTFARGLNTADSLHQVPFGAHVVLQNCDLDERGAAEKRWGYATYLSAFGSAAFLGVYELIRNDGTAHLLTVKNDGKLYKRTSSADTAIPIRLATPYGTTATNGSSGAVGANLVSATKYQYAFCAVDATGRTLASTTISATSGEVTTGATAYPVAVTAYGVYGAVTYQVFRRTYSGSAWGSWGRLTTGLTHATASGKTQVTHTDDGNTVPDTAQGLPSANTTEHTLSTSTDVDWMTARQAGNNAAYFLNGIGLCWTDGTNAQMQQPSTETLGGAAIGDATNPNNLLWDITSAVYSARRLHLHHNAVFTTRIESEPQRFYYSDQRDPGYFSNKGFVAVPDAKGGAVLDFATKDKALLCGLDTSVWALWGTQFPVTGPDASVNYFSQVYHLGVLSPTSMVEGPEGIVTFLGSDKMLYGVRAVSAVQEQIYPEPIGQSIRPTLEALTDGDSCAALYDGKVLYFAFPADKRVIKLYRIYGEEGAWWAPALDAFPTGFAGLMKRAKGDKEFLSWDYATGQMYQMYKNEQYTDNGTAVTWKVKTPHLDLGRDIALKDFERLFLISQQSGVVTITLKMLVDDVSKSTSFTTAATGTYGTAKYGTGTYTFRAAVTTEKDISQEGFFIQIEISNASTTERPKVFGLRFEAYVDKP